MLAQRIYVNRAKSVSKVLSSFFSVLQQVERNNFEPSQSTYQLCTLTQLRNFARKKPQVIGNIQNLQWRQANQAEQDGDEEEGEADKDEEEDKDEEDEEYEEAKPDMTGRIHVSISNSQDLDHLDLVLNDYLEQMDLAHIASAFSQINVVTPKELDRMSKAMVWQLSDKLRERLASQLKNLMPMHPGKDKARLIRSLAAIRVGTRPDKLVTFLLKSLPNEIEAYSLSEKEQILFACSLINYDNTSVLRRVIESLEKQLIENRFEAQKYPRVWSGLIYSIVMLRMENVGLNVINLCLQKLEEMDFDKTFLTFDAATLLIFALACIHKEPGPLLKSILITNLSENVMKMTKLHLVHAMYGLNALKWVDGGGDAVMLLCNRLNMNCRQLSPQQITEVLYGMAQGGVKHGPLLSRILQRMQVMASRKLIAKNQLLALLRCLQILGMEKSDLDNIVGIAKVDFVHELNGDLPDIREVIVQKEQKLQTT
eukprot:TRINITY_DN19687_c0_g1_i4.p1 TRINITY_DN19687_c0_g1~~TRINITY_DN19687_c0_g1_i4.p1  ORF type:complete len:483 (+),score=46.40 TRINITY_DN19687_c0_g1_i4:115-1563(+)